MGSKSTPSTTTTVNPLGQAQAPFLGGLWTAGQSNAGLTGDGSQPLGQSYIDQLRNYAQNAFSGTADAAIGLPQHAIGFANQILSGQFPQEAMPAGPQIGGLNAVGGAAAGAGTNYGNQIAGAAYGAPGAIAPYATGLQNLAGGAQNSGLQYGGAVANAAGQAPGMVAPWTGGLNALSGRALSVGNPAMAGLYGNAGMAVSDNPIYDSLRGMASGQYIDPRSNPALAGTIQAATQPLVNQYQTAVAPQLESSFEGGGRYGSGAATNARGQAQYGLGQALSGATSNIVNNAYNTGLQATLGAGSALGQAYNTGIGNTTSALGTAGQLGQTGVTSAGNLMQAGGALDLSSLQAMMSGLSSAGGLANAGYGTAGTLMGSGGQLALGGQNALTQGLGAAAGATNQGYGTATNAYAQGGGLANAGALNLGGIAQMAPDLANYPLTQMSAAYNAGWLPLQNYAGILGQPQSPGASTTQPYYSNTLSQVGSALSGAAAIAPVLAKI